MLFNLLLVLRSSLPPYQPLMFQSRDSLHLRRFQLYMEDDIAKKKNKHPETAILKKNLERLLFSLNLQFLREFYLQFGLEK